MSADARHDVRAHDVAIRAALDPSLSPFKSWRWGSVPGSGGNMGVLPDVHVQVSISERVGANRRSSGESGLTFWRANFVVGGVSWSDSAWALYSIAKALHETPLLIGEWTSSPFNLDGTGRAPLLKDGRSEAAVTYTYSL